MKSTCARIVFGLSLALAGSIVAGAADKKVDATQAQAVLLDHSEYICRNCLFTNSEYFFCFNANSKILIGHENVRTKMLKKTPENLMGTRGKTVPIKYDDKYIWIPGPNGKDQKLVQDYTKNPFIFNNQCQKAIKTSTSE